MSRNLPNLNALRVFEAAARHLSFTRAAAELHVTQAAVSHQVKALEDRLGIKLFRRINRALMLTDAGQAYLPAVRDAFDRLSAATDKLGAREASGVLTVSVLPSFAAKWLVPRLGRFRTKHPEIDVRVSASTLLADFARDDVDLAIRFGLGRYPNLYSLRLLTEEVFPVCSPALAKGHPPLRRPQDLVHHTLLHDDAPQDWPMWLKAAGVDGVNATRGPVFYDSGMLVQAAVEGQGVALGRSALVAGDLAAGRLVKPFTVTLPATYAYYVVCPEAVADRPKIVAFRDWLVAEAEAEQPAKTRVKKVSLSRGERPPRRGG